MPVVSVQAFVATISSCEKSALNSTSIKSFLLYCKVLSPCNVGQFCIARYIRDVKPLSILPSEVSFRWLMLAEYPRNQPPMNQLRLEQNKRNQSLIESCQSLRGRPMGCKNTNLLNVNLCFYEQPAESRGGRIRLIIVYPVAAPNVKDHALPNRPKTTIRGLTELRPYPETPTKYVFLSEQY